MRGFSLNTIETVESLVKVFKITLIISWYYVTRMELWTGSFSWWKCHWPDFMQDGWKAVRSIPYVSVAFFPSLKQNFIAYGSSKVSSCPDCIFEIHQLWQSGFSRLYSSCCCSCWFEPEIIKIGQSSHKMYSNNILNFQESTTILNACTKKSLETYWRHYASLKFCVSV